MPDTDQYSGPNGANGHDTDAPQISAAARGLAILKEREAEMARAHRVREEMINIEVAIAADLSPAGYEVVRETIAERVGVRCSVLDRLVAEARRAKGGDADTGGQGRRLEIPDVEPWPKKVDGAALLDEIDEAIRRHVVLDEAAAEAAALWVIHTHAIDAAYVSPRLAITSPQKRCGKTTLLLQLSGLVARPGTSANLTAATMFRAIHAARPTMLIDEADTFLGDAEEMRGVINAGHCRGTATVWRTVEAAGGHEVREFDVWAPVALAAIGKLPGTIEDRSIKIAMRRRRPDEKVERLRLDKLGDLEPIARRAARWAKDNLDALRAADPDVPAELHDRAADNWRALLAIADLAGGTWSARARKAAQVLTKDGAEDQETTGTILLADIRAAFAERGADRLSSDGIVSYLIGLEGRPWAEYGKSQKPLTKNLLARLLRPFQVFPGTVQLGEGRAAPTAKGYHLSDFEDAFARYLPALPDQAVKPSDIKQSAAFVASQTVRPGACLTVRNGETPSNSVMSDGLTVANPLPAANGHAHISEAPFFIPLPGEREPGADEDDGFVRRLD